MDDRSMALEYLLRLEQNTSCSNPAVRQSLIFHVLLPSRSSQLSKFRTNEIKHDIHPE